MNEETKEKTKIKIKPPSKMNGLLDKLKIDNNLTKPIHYKFPTVKNNIFPKAEYNYQSDLLELPKTKLGYRYLLVMVDLWSNYFDIEPLKNKESNTVLEAMKKIFKRDILSLPKASMRTDQGTEFKGKVDNFLYNENVLHLLSLPDRHKQMANVERLNRDIGLILMTYLTNQTHLNGHEYNEWTDLVDSIRKELNEIRSHPKDKNPYESFPQETNFNDPKYQVGDLVYRKLEKPLDKFGNKYHNTKFRGGDSRFEINEPRKIVKILPFGKSWRYLLNGLLNVSYDEAELMRAKESEEKFIILKIIDKKKIKGVLHYLVWWKRYKKSQSTFEPKDKLIEDGASEYIDEYENSLKK